MEPDCYLVEILHYLNPHLIWVKVSNGSSAGHMLEQIGVYGILPMNMVVDIGGDDVTHKRCETWQPAAAMVMRKVFLEATEVRFQPIHIDRRSSIFDSNIHKYGEILIIKSDGKQRKLSRYLEKSKFAQYDEVAFYQELSSGRMSTKLSKDAVDVVMKEIESNMGDNNSEVSFKKQTTVYRTAKKLEALTTENLDKHNKIIKSKKMINGKDVMNVLERKFKDLELCKDLDEVSVGRAITRSRMRETQEQVDRLDVNDRKVELLNNNNLVKVNDVKESEDIKVSVQQINESATAGMAVQKSGVHEDQSAFARADESRFVRRRYPHQNKTKSPKAKLPEYNVLKEKCIAYSPPGVDKSKLPLKVVPLHQETYGTAKEEKVEEELLELNDDMFGKVDSDINIKITNKEVLIGLNKASDNRSVKEQNEIIPMTSKTIESQTVTDDSSSETRGTLKSRILQRKLKIHNENLKSHSSVSSVSNTTNKDTSSSGDGKRNDYSDDDVSEIIEKYKAGTVTNVIETKLDRNVHLTCRKNNVNPFKNVDPDLSVFVHKLVSPVLMVHTKNDARIEPKSTLSEIPFNSNIHNALKNMNVQRPMTIQSVSWFSILRGYSVLLIGPKGCGKTMGYLPSVCRLISDSDNDIVNSVGPTCVIVCATARSVAEVEFQCRMFLGPKDRMFSCYAGMDILSVTTSLLNGCDLFICTPCVLARLLLQTDFGLDLRRLTTFVFDDCERLDDVYKNEIKVVLFKIKEMLKTRANKEVKVQYVLASRVWCDFMEPLAKKAPNTVVCIGAFQECVLYSKANTSVDFVKAENKNAKVLDFLEKNEKNKKTVIVCREDKEVDELERILKRMKFIVFTCNSEMTVEDLRNLNKAWDEYADPLSGPILVCCDGNLSHMNVTDAHYLIHYSMPELFSMFCKRFCVLNDHYPSIFKTTNDSVSVKIILEDSNAEQLPKICNFVKRCTKEFPSKLVEICQEIMNRKDLVRAENHVPICGNLLALGECPDFWYCRERHTSSETHDVPKDWVPTEGVITFKILHYQTAVLYSARLLSNIKKGGTKKYAQTYSTLSLKMGMYFSQECNQKLHGIPKVGDICAVALKQNFFIRCQVVDILNKYRTGNPNHVLIKLIDEERMETSRDIYLYHLPKELREIETHVIQIRLAGIIPKDKDVTFSDLATAQLKKAVEKNEDLYMRGKVVLSLGNLIFVDNVDVCQDLSSMNEVVVKNNFKELLEPHSEAFPDHINILKSGLSGNTKADTETTDTTNFDEIEEVAPVRESPEAQWAHLEAHSEAFSDHINTLESCVSGKEVTETTDVTNFDEIEEVTPVRAPKAQWAHLEREDMSVVYFTTAIDPDTFFVRLSKFEDATHALGLDIDKYVEQNPGTLTNVKENDIVLVKHPDDQCYERARVDAVDGKKAKCFFVDHGDWKDVPLQHLIEIPSEFITRLPFQAIECRLVGIQPVGEEWTDFSTNWLCDRCVGEDLKKLYAKFVSSDKAKYTGGTKYAVALFDTNRDNDIMYNNLMMDLNLAAPNDDEIEILNAIDFMKSTHSQNPSKTNEIIETNNDDWEITATSGKSNLPSNLIRSVPLVPDDDSDSDRWSFNMPDEIMKAFKNNSGKQNAKGTDSKVFNKSKATVVEVPETVVKPQTTSPDSSDVSTVNISKDEMSEYEVIAPLKLKELDSDDFSSVESQLAKPELLKEVSKGRKPKILWRQNKSTVTLKIMLLGVEEYEMEVLERSISFSANVYDTHYNFKMELYSIVKKNDCSHSNKGQYIVVKLVKVMQKNWLSLTRGSDITKWIVYDVDSIDASSDEEETQDNRVGIFKHLQDDESESDDDFCDDANFSYKRR